MSTIRPDLPQTLPGTTPSAQVRTAQAAFFRAALNEVQAAPPRAQTPAAARTATAAPPDDSPRLPRLGQLLDIRV
ncbi:MAG: hypothetical protein Q8S03_08200 [Brevundimonas sp.]|uniref:hypothetical protein n=1 Tax=Brevundimonas sp. TaxID=1871086 RepID=UPI00273634AE|nr:hypothetical protein [Brevundimonas sp.]MDP3404656.1 hypothetical protein [Brevundimonas sp.]